MAIGFSVLYFLSDKYFYLFFRNILNLFFFCDKNILIMKAKMIRWLKTELAWQRGYRYLMEVFDVA